MSAADREARPTEAGAAPHASRRRWVALGLGVLGAALLLADFAPTFARLSGSRLAESFALLAHAALAPTCHQRVLRCLVVAGAPLSACARCTGLHLGGVLASLAIFPPLELPARTRRLLVVATAMPLLLDVLLGIAWPAWDHPMLRLATGALAVVGAAVGAMAGS
jgi:uncharacterized membrane protein